MEVASHHLNEQDKWEVRAIRRLWAKRLGLDHQAVIRGLMMAFSAWVAFALASIWHMTNAYWAAMAVWVVVQPLRGMLFERALMRVVGTALGALVGFMILWCAPNSIAQIVLLSLWMTLCAGAMHLIKGIYPYALLLTGITTSAVVLPSAITSSYQPELGWSRVVCTLIGVVVVTVVMSVYTPKASRRDYYREARQLVADAVDFAVKLLQGVSENEAQEREQDVLFRMSQLESSAHTVAAGSLTGHKQLRHVEALIASAMEVMASAVAVYRQSLHEEGHTVTEEEMRVMAAYMQRLANHLRLDDATFKKLLLQPALILDHAPVHSGIASRMSRALEQLVAAAAALYAGGLELASEKPRKLTSVRPPSLASAVEIDWARQSALATGVTALGVSLSGWLMARHGWFTGSHAPALMATGVSMFCMVLAALPFPRMTMKTMFTGVVVGTVVALLYRLLIQPHLHTLSQVLVSLVPFLLVCGLARASSKTAGPALDANTNFLLVGQVMFPPLAASTGQIFVDSVAVVLGVAVACLIGLWLLPRRADDQAYMAAAAITRDLQRMLERSADYFQRHDEAEQEWQSHSEREVLRMMLHLGGAKALRKKAPRGVLGVLNLGSVIVRLQQLASPVSRQGLQAMAYFAEDTHATIRAVWNLAKENADDPAANILYEAADALLACEQLLTFGQKPSEEDLV